MGGNLFGIGFGELVFIVILALIIFGPKRIPEVARTIGRFLQQVRQATSGIEDEMRQLMSGEGDPASWLAGTPPKGPVALPPSPAEPFSPPPLPTGEGGPAPTTPADEPSAGPGDHTPDAGAAPEGSSTPPPSPAG